MSPDLTLAFRQSQLDELKQTKEHLDYFLGLHKMDMLPSENGNKDAEIMYKAFEIAGYSKQDVDKKFGHMIEAFSYGAPPHCGFAPGIERLAMLLLGEPNIRAVVPFPKNQKAEEPMMGSPSEVDEKQLKELRIRIEKK